MMNRFVYWFWFGVGLSVLPIAISCWILCAINTETQFTENLFNSISKGELLIVCTAILGVNIGDLFRDETIEKWKLLKFSLVGASMVVAIFTGCVFIAISVTTEKVSKPFIAHTSLLLFVVTIIICVCSILIPRSR